MRSAAPPGGSLNATSSADAASRCNTTAGVADASLPSERRGSAAVQRSDSHAHSFVSHTWCADRKEPDRCASWDVISAIAGDIARRPMADRM